MVEYSTGPTATQILLSGLDSSDRKYGSRRKRAVRTSGNIDAVEQQLVLSLEDASGTHSTVHHFEDKNDVIIGANYTVPPIQIQSTVRGIL